MGPLKYNNGSGGLRQPSPLLCLKIPHPMFTCAYMILQNPADGINLFYIILALSALLGILLVIPIGGADMPVVISLLNSYSGIAAAMTGFVLVASGNDSAGNALIICGSLVGASGMILTQIMCKGMNRSLANVIFGAVGGEVEGPDGGRARGVQQGDVEGVPDRGVREEGGADPRCRGEQLGAGGAAGPHPDEHDGLEVKGQRVPRRGGRP